MQSIAQTILDQLGGRKFMAMTGVKQFLGDTDSITFGWPSTATKNKANKCRITLNSLDLYDLEFFRIRGGDCKEVGSDQNVYAEDLQRVFTAATGLQTHL